jgi:mRNA-degrading endonuclease RelE of RelBE toxin-antitoxin system
MQFIFTKKAESDFFRLEKSIQPLIRKKLDKIKKWEWYHIKALINISPATHRLKIQNMRLILREIDEWFEVITIGHRSTIYT